MEKIRSGFRISVQVVVSDRISSTVPAVGSGSSMAVRCQRSYRVLVRRRIAAKYCQ